MTIPSHDVDMRTRGAQTTLDRRRKRRKPSPIPLRIFLPEIPGDHFYPATCVNLNEGGLAFETDAVIDLNSEVEVEFHQQGQPVFRRRVRLLYRMQTRYGGYFSASCAS